MLLGLQCSGPFFGPDTSFLAAAFSCSTKSRAREKRPGPIPLRSETHPRGLPSLKGEDLHRVLQDNLMANFGLAAQEWLANHGGGCIRENPVV